MLLRALLLLTLARPSLAQDSHAGPVTDLAVFEGMLLSCSQAGVLVKVADEKERILRPGFRVIALRSLPRKSSAAPARILVAGGRPGESGEIARYTLVRNGQPKIDGSAEIARDLVYAIDVSRDGKHVYAGLADGRVLELDPENLESKKLVHKHTAPIRAVQLSPDGHCLATAGVDGLVIIRDLRSENDTSLADARKLVLTEHTSAVESLAFSPDSSRLASGSRDGRVRIHSRAGRFLRTYRLSRRTVSALSWTGGDRGLRATTLAGELVTLSLKPEAEVIDRRQLEGPAHSIAETSKGRLLVGLQSRIVEIEVRR